MTAPAAVASSAIEQARAAFQAALYLPDPAIVDLVLGAIAANILPGRPCWLLIVGPSGGGKTEILNAASRLANTYLAGTLTEAALLSGTPKRERGQNAKGGLLRTIGEFGILLLKDFTSVLSMNRDTRAGVLAALREIYDGRWVRHVGTDGGQELSWEGKIGLIGCCTPTIDQHHAVIASMGERWLTFRLPPSDPELQSLKAIENAWKARDYAGLLAEAVKRVIASMDASRVPEPTVGDASRLTALATLVAHSRSATERNPYNRELEFAGEPEMPARLAQSLTQLHAGLAAIDVDAETRWEHICKVGLDSIPLLWRRLLIRLIAQQEAEATSDIAEAIGHPTTTVRRALEDLSAHGVLMRIKTGQGGADLWAATPAARDRWERAGIPDRIARQYEPQEGGD